MSIHTQRLGAEFKKVLSEVIRDCVKDPRLSGLCSVTNVEITKDLKHAKVPQARRIPLLSSTPRPA